MDMAARPARGPDLDQIWTRSGPDWDQIWTRSGPDLDQIWTRLGPDLDQIWTRSGPDWDQIWSQFGSALGRILARRDRQVAENPMKNHLFYMRANDPRTVHTKSGPGSGSLLDHFWYHVWGTFGSRSGPNLVQIWTRLGPDLDQIWS